MSLPNKDPEIIRAIILDHYENPKHHLGDNGNNSKLKGYVECNISSASCIDNLTAYIKVLNSVIKDVKFSGVGCAISTSSTDIMCNLLRKLFKYDWQETLWWRIVRWIIFIWKC